MLADHETEREDYYQAERRSRSIAAVRMVALATAIIASASSGANSDGAVAVVQNPGARIRTWEVGGGRLPLVLLHGYGSSPDQWLPFTQTIHARANRRFVFPEAPEVSIPPDGPVGGRAWWRLDLASYRTPENGLPDLSRAPRPAGLSRSVGQIQRLIADLQRRLGYRRDNLILGGFSQGAIIAADVAFRTNVPLHALVLLSGTTVDETSWITSMRRRRGLPVFIAHGRRDDIFRFETSHRLQQAMRDAGLRVTWVPFEGGHEIPAEVVDALNAFLAQVDDSQ